MIRFLLSILVVSTFMSGPRAEATASKKLTFVSFNTRYYGLGGEMENTPADETRQPAFREFFDKVVPHADVYAFQEVVDVAHVQGVLAPADYNCLTYKNDFPKHQHVVLCVNPKFQIMHEPNDDNDVIDEVAGAEGRSRPALHFILGDAKGKPLVRLVGVHLKAFPDQSATRIGQAREIAKFLTTVADPALPIVVTGDFNSFNHDEDDIAAILSPMGIEHVKNPSPYTFRTAMYSSRFDHFYISSTLKLASPMWTYEVCNVPATAVGMTAVQTYNDTLSDHCPIAIEVKL